jgi:hypothetical protein
MHNHHVLAALATERRNTLLAQAQAARRAEQARSPHQRADASTDRQWAPRWALRLLAVRPESPAFTTDQPVRS